MSVNRLMVQSPSDRHILILTSFLPITLIQEINVVTTCTASSNLKEPYILPTECTYGFCMSLRTKTVIASLNSITYLVLPVCTQFSVRQKLNF